MKKILVLHNRYRILGGEDTAVENEIEFLKRKYKVEIIYFNNNSKNLLNILFSLIFISNFLSNSVIKKKVKEFKPDLVYVHNTWFVMSLGFLKYLKKAKIPVVFKLHNFRYSCCNTYSITKHLNLSGFCEACGLIKKRGQIFNKYFSNSYIKSIMVIRHSTKLYKFIMGTNFKIIVLTSFHKNFLISCGVQKENIYIIPNPISFTNHSEKISIKEVIYAGSISKEKGLIELIDIFERLELDEYILRIIGDGPLLKELKNQEFKKTIIEGPLDNKTTKNIISKSELVITCTKLFEGQPTLLCEASSMGVPSIFPKTGGISEFFPTDYEFAFEQYDYEQLENKIITFVNTNPKRDIGKKNQDYLRKFLSEEFFVTQFDKLLDSLRL